MAKLIQIHSKVPGFRQYGHRFGVSTLVEVSEDGKPSAGGPALVAITPAQFAHLQWLVGTPNSPLTYSDPDEAAKQVGEAEAKLVELSQHLTAMERQKEAAVTAAERLAAERAAMEAEIQAKARQLAEMEAQIAERERAVEALEQRVAEQRAILEEQAPAGVPPVGQRGRKK
jgi:septal ring factor EnvC (AmiA/AmiB activator)